MSKEKTKIPPAPQILIDDAAEPEGETKSRTNAFNADDLTYQGQPLSPWTSGKEAHWSEVRAAVGAPPLHELRMDSAGWFPDALRILYLSLHTKESYRDRRSDPIALQEAIEEWSDQNVPVSETHAVCLLTMRIYNTAHENEAHPAPPEKPSHGDDLGN